MKIGDNEVEAVYFGSRPLVAIYLGDNIVWSADQTIITAALQANSTLSGSLAIFERVGGTIQAVSSLNAPLSRLRGLAGTLNAASFAGAPLTVTRDKLFAGELAAISAIAAGLLATRGMAGVTAALSSASAAQFDRACAVAAVANSISSNSGSIDIVKAFAGATNAASALTAPLSRNRQIAGATTALSALTAPLTVTPGVRTKVGSFDTGTAANGNNVAVTGVGFQPVIVLFFWSGGIGADSVAGGDSRLGVGYGISSTSRAAQSIWYDDANASGATSRSLFNERCIAINTDETEDGALDFVSMDSDGFTLVVDNQMPSSYRIHYLAIGGASVTASGAQMTLPASPGNSDVTTLGAPPSMLGIITNAYTTINAPFNDGINARFISAFSDMTDDISLMINSQNATAAAVNAVAMFNSEVYLSSALRGVVSTLVNGFRIAWSASNAAAHLMWYRLNGVQCKVGSFQTRTDTTPQAITGLGFKPQAVIFMSGGQTTINSEVAATERGSWGAVDSALNQRVASSKSVHAADPTNVGLGHNSAAVYQQIADGDTQEGLMQINSLDADGFTFQMADADPSARYVTYVAIG